MGRKNNVTLLERNRKKEKRGVTDISNKTDFSDGFG